MRFEIRRLHEAFGITTLYVTHDQAEAMAISDRIAVLDRGHLAQVGTPAELFDHPRTRFVAEFIGKTNVMDASVVAPDLVAVDAVRLRVAATGLRPGASVLVSVRPHLVAVVDTATESDAARTVVRGTVVRQAYLGDTVQAEVKLDGAGVTLRVATRTSTKLSTKGAVALAIPTDAVVPIVEGDASIAGC
jgi:ABC-type Fe3+/spermidine/putrescine transport system ATPase subunit